MRDEGFLTIKAGQHLTSVRDIAKGVGYYEQMKWEEPNPKTISRILTWLEKQSMISVDRGRGNRQYTLITLLNWESYQVINEDGNTLGTPLGEGRTQPVDINKNDKECLKNDLEGTAADAHACEDPIGNEESAGTPETEPQPEVKEVAQTSVVLLQHYLQLKGQMHPSPKDHEAALEVEQQGVPSKQAIQYLEEKFQEFNKTKKHPRDQINSLNYCTGYILDRYYESKETKSKGQNRSNNGNQQSRYANAF